MPTKYTTYREQHDLISKWHSRREGWQAAQEYQAKRIVTLQDMIVQQVKEAKEYEATIETLLSQQEQLINQVTQLQLNNARMREEVSTAFSKLKSLPRFSFLSPVEGGVRRFADKSGNWVEQYEVVKIYDNLEEALSTQPTEYSPIINEDSHDAV